MTSFAPDWLDLREPADRRARSAELRDAALAAARRKPVVVDLGCGTGATFRAFGPEASRLSWRLVDNDMGLLAKARERTEGDVHCLHQDLRDIDTLPFDDAGLVTASALFDLVSAPWAETFCRLVTRAGASVYSALTYDGHVSWSPELEDDAAVLEAFNRHQLGDKGLGPALGPGAVEAFRIGLSRRGYDVRIEPSPWRLGPSDAALQVELARGMAQAATEMGADAGRMQRWLEERTRLAATGGCEVGHQDIFAALPPSARARSQSNSTSEPR